MIIQKLIIKNYGKIGDGQKFVDVMPVIPTNTIIYKTMPGLGATFAEIKADRDSVLIEPNVPVIIGKCNQQKHKDDNLLGVYHGISYAEVIIYLQNTLKEGKRIKIMVTPESFTKVVDALKRVGLDIRKDCFVLHDEIQHLVKDPFFRKGIGFPMDIFFQCQNKAMVSATPINIYMDPRFSDFEILKIGVTNFQPIIINLELTTDIVLRAKEIIMSKLQEGKPLFVFLNDTNSIEGFIKYLSCKKLSSIFCSNDGVRKLNEHGFNRAYSIWDNTNMREINWLTSRFYNAVDIELLEKPNVVLISDVWNIPYTIIDPYSDAIQITGRFRNGIASLTHITNSNNNNLRCTEAYFLADLNKLEKEYNMLKLGFKTTVSPDERSRFYSEMSVHAFSKFVNNDGSLNYLKLSNEIYDDLIKGKYFNWHTIIDAYKDCGFFHVTSNVEPYIGKEREHLPTTRQNKSSFNRIQAIVFQLDDLRGSNDEVAMEHKRMLDRINHTIVRAYDLLGSGELKSLNFSYRKIKIALIKKEHDIKARSKDVYEYVDTIFKVGSRHTVKYIKEQLTIIYKDMGVPEQPKVTGETIKIYFVVKPTKIYGQRGYTLNKKLFNC